MCSDLPVLTRLVRRAEQLQAIDSQMRLEAFEEIIEYAKDESFLFRQNKTQELISRAIELDAFGLSEPRA